MRERERERERVAESSHHSLFVSLQCDDFFFLAVGRPPADRLSHPPDCKRPFKVPLPDGVRAQVCVCVFVCVCLVKRMRVMRSYKSTLDERMGLSNSMWGMRSYIGTDEPRWPNTSTDEHTSAYVSIRQHTSAYVSIRQHT